MSVLIPFRGGSMDGKKTMRMDRYIVIANTGELYELLVVGTMKIPSAYFLIGTAYIYHGTA